MSSPVWNRGPISAFGSPPKCDVDTPVSSATFRHNQSTIRRVPNKKQMHMLRKTRNFALHKFSQAYPTEADSDWADVCVMPPREPAELRAEWVRSALVESGALPDTASIVGLEAQALIPNASLGFVQRFGLNYEGGSRGGWPSHLVLKRTSFGPHEDPQLATEQAYCHAEIMFLTEAVGTVPAGAVLTPIMYWSFCRPPGNGEIRPHWQWAKGRFPEHPWALGEYCCLLEDLNHNNSTAADEELTMEAASQIVEALAKMHGAFWEAELLGNKCFSQRRSIELADVRTVVSGLVDRSQLEDHVAEVYIPAIEVRTMLLEEVARHGRTLTRGSVSGSLNNWIMTPQGPTSMSWGHIAAGSGAHDLAQFLTLGLNKEQQQEWTHSLVDLYYSRLVISGVDGGVYSKEWFIRDYQTCLWEVSHEHLLRAGRALLSLPPLGPETPYRERKRVTEAIGPHQAVISAVCRALALGDAWQVIGIEDGSSDDA